MPNTLYRTDSDRDGLTDAQELALGTDPLSPDSDGDGQADLVELLSGRQATFDEMRQVLQHFLDQDYETYIKSLLSVETGVVSASLLSDLYAYYMANDHIQLLDDQILEVVSTQEQMIKEDLSRLFETLYGLGEGNEFISDILGGERSETLVSKENWQLGDFDPYSLETLDNLILHQLPRESDDYFGDLVQLALEQDKLDSRSHFLRRYMAELTPSQRELSLEPSLTL